MKFKICVGSHVGGTPGNSCYYKEGDVCASTSNLEEHNGQGMTKKFERMDDSVPDTYGYELDADGNLVKGAVAKPANPFTVTPKPVPPVKATTPSGTPAPSVFPKQTGK